MTKTRRCCDLLGNRAREAVLSGRWIYSCSSMTGLRQQEHRSVAATWKPPSQRGRNPPRSHLPSLVSNRAGLSFRLAWDRTRDQGPITGKRDSPLHLVVRLAGNMCVMIFRSLLIRVDALALIRIGCSPCMKRCQHPARPLQYYSRPFARERDKFKPSGAGVF